MAELTRGAPAPTYGPDADVCVYRMRARREGGEGPALAPGEELRVVNETCDHPSLASTAPGGRLQEIADRYALGTGAAVEELVGHVLSDGVASDVELAAFAPVLHSALRDVLAVALRE